MQESDSLLTQEIGQEARTVRLSESIVQENVIALQYGADLIDELTGLSQSKKMFDVVIVDCTKVGYFFTAEVLIEAGQIAKSLLEIQGALAFVKSDKAVAIVKETAIGHLTFQVFDNLSEVYNYSPSLARHIQVALGGKTEISDETGDLSEQLLMSAVPVLTSFGIKLKAGMESTKRRNQVLAVVDNYTPLSGILQRLSGRFSMEEVLDELRSMEESGAIFPLFAKIPFLVHCFRSKIPFKLKDYLLEARLITQDQLDNILVSLHNTRGSDRLNIGALCVSKGLITSRQLEVALQDQAYYGQGGDEDKMKVLIDSDQESKVHSLVGHLGTTDAAGVLQSLSNNRESGILSVEHKDLHFRAVFEQGKLVRAKQGKLKGNAAVVEFVSVWRDGIFVFIERQVPADLADDSCKVTRPLDKLLLDSALASDNIDVVWKKLPRGSDTPLEKGDDSLGLLDSGNLVDPQDQTPLKQEELAIMQRLWKELDGLISVAAATKRLGNITTLQAAQAVNRLLHWELVRVPKMDLAAPLEKFQMIASSVSEEIGVERSNALLRLSLSASQGYSARARMFMIGTAGEIGVDLALARSAGLSLSHVVKQLEDWQVKYIEYVSQELDKNTLRDIVYKVHQRS